ncbi:phosphodiesterase [Micromonosporaceae bacterium DT194]|uniref:phosphodiesterase n=1 Tax=Melissospora conviva TaxID=3388432 RepID=UPI003C15F036
MRPTGTGSAARNLARLRGGRLLHPRGRSFTATAELWGPPADAVADGPGCYRATVRLSRGVPTPQGWPDVLGLAVRLHRPAGPVDLLVSTSGSSPLLRHLPLPRRDFAGPYSSIASYRRGRQRIYLAALADRPLGSTLDSVGSLAAQGAARLRLATASATGLWRPFARITLGDPLTAATDAALGFDPIGNHPPGLLPAGPVQRLRAATYPVSRRARGAAGNQPGPEQEQVAGDGPPQPGPQP